MVMKNFNARAILEHPRRVMTSIGIWPEVKSSVSYNIRGLLVFTILITATILFLMKDLENCMERNYENGSYVLCIMLATGHVAFKVWFLLTNKSLFFELLTNLEDPSLLYHNETFDTDLQDKIQFSMKMFNTLILLCENATMAIVICEYILGYNSGPRLLPIKTDPNQLLTYISVWVFLVVTAYYCGLIVGSFEGLVLIFLSLGIGQLQILQKKIIRAVDDYPSEIILTQEEVQYYNKVVNAKLGKCVQRHNAIERIIAAIETKFSIGFLIQYFITLCVTGLLGLNFVFASPTSPDFIRCVFFFIADLMQVFVVYYHCNEIILESENVRDACYMSNWTSCGSSVRKTLFLIMERTKRPFYLTLGKFSIISLETFVIILKTSMSYFTVLKGMYEDDPNIK